jgi:hypothetical protein
MPIVPDPSAASWSRREAVMGKRATSATTAPQTPMPEAFFTAGEDGLLVTAFEVDDAVGVQPGLGERRRKQVQSRDTPEHLAARAGGDPCRKKRGGRAVNRSVATASDLMQCAERQRPAGEPSVHRRDAEG